MAEANEKLREARERTASSADPDSCLSRQELAELVNAWIWEHRKKAVALSANYIGQLERGKISWPGKLYREAFRAILGVTSDAALGFVNTRRAVVKLDNVKRKQFIQNTLSLGALAALGPMAALLEGLLEDNEPTPVPNRVGATEIEQIRTATREFESWVHAYGGELTREAVRGQLRWSAGCLKATCPDRLRPELFSAVGDLAETAGFAAVDAGAHQEARRLLRFALSCAEEAEDWPLRAEVLSNMAEHAIRWTGQPDEGLTLAEYALVRPDRLTATGRALLYNDRAWALAKMHRISETLTAVGTADEHFAHANPANDPRCMAFYDAPYHARCAGGPLCDLVMLGHNPDEATHRLTAAAAGHAEGNARSRAICLAKLATITMVTGDPLEAAAIGHAALDAADTIRSRRVAGELRELARYTAPHQHLEADHLRQRTGALLRRIDSP